MEVDRLTWLTVYFIHAIALKTEKMRYREFSLGIHEKAPGIAIYPCEAALNMQPGLAFNMRSTCLNLLNARILSLLRHD